MRIDRLIAVLLMAGLLQACVAVNPQQSKNEKASAINVQLGIGYLQQNKLELASEKLSKAIAQNPDSAAAHNAYAILQDRLKQIELAEFHYRKATSLDPKDSQAANNYGTFLCRNGRELESEKYFLQALDNPLYNTPEYAYTNAAICLIKAGQTDPGKGYLRKALAAKSDFSPALLSMAELLFEEGDHAQAKIYLDRFHLVARATAKSLWLSIRNELQLDSNANVEEYALRLEKDFYDSPEYQAWLKIQ
ncbi:MAG: type IV pilus biogenesis/stability protein PilW [Gammaproteobacteria bacterium]|nr:type IV pilus biogenesis/stability protein PilW [Gammaproteobacteria bacterium]